MLRPILLVKVGLGGLAFAARWGQNARAPLPAPAVERTEAEPEPAGEPAESAGAFLRRHIELELGGRFGRSWDELHPAHQQVVSRVRYERCRTELFARAGASARLEAFEVLQAVDEPLDAAGIPETTSKAVTVRLRIGGNGSSHAASETLHAVQVGRRWTWILPEDAYHAYESGSSPGARKAS
jgi:hypothetical protein